MKPFRVNHVPWCAPEGLAALVRARSLESAVRKVKEGRDLRLPDGTYWLAEQESPAYYTTFQPVQIV